MLPRCHGWRSGAGARARPRCPAAHSPVVKDRSTYSGAQRPARGVGARCPHAARQPTPMPHPPGTSVRGCSRTGRAPRRPCLPWVVVEERVQGGATGLRCDRAPLRLAPEEVARREPATAAPAGLCIARSAPRLLYTRVGDRGTHVQAHCRREGVSMLLSRGAEARDGCEGDTIGRTSRDESPGRRLPYGLSSAPRPWLW